MYCVYLRVLFSFSEGVSYENLLSVFKKGINYYTYKMFAHNIYARDGDVLI